MLDYLENLRKKPEAERRKSVFVISFSITLIITLIWIGSLFVQSKVDVVSLDGSGISRTIPSVKDTFSSFFGTVKNIFSNSAVFENTEIDEATEVPENLMPVYEPEVIDQALPLDESTETEIIEPETSVSSEVVQ